MPSYPISKKCQKGQTSTARTAWGIDQSEDHLTDIYGSPQSHGTAMPFPLAGANLACVEDKEGYDIRQQLRGFVWQNGDAG